MDKTAAVTALPAAGWRVRHEDGGHTEPIVGWVVGADGYAIALIDDGNGGGASPATGWAGIEVYHPDSDTERRTMTVRTLDVDTLLEADFLGRAQTLTLEDAERRLKNSVQARVQGRRGEDRKGANELELAAERGLWFSILGYRSVAYDAAGLTATLVRMFADSAHKIVDAHKLLMHSMIRGDDEPDIAPLLSVLNEFREGPGI